MSTSAYSSSRTPCSSESHLPWKTNLERCAQRSLSLRDRRNPTHILVLERGHSDLGDVPLRSDAGSHSATLVWPVYRSGAGLIQKDPGAMVFFFFLEAADALMGGF